MGILELPADINRRLLGLPKTATPRDILRQNERVYFCPRWPSWLSDR